MNNRSSQVIGVIVFFLGIAILAAVAYMVFVIFLSEEPAVTQLLNDSKTPLANLLSSWAANTLVKIVMLIFMTVAGSLIADKGIKMYFGPREK